MYYDSKGELLQPTNEQYSFMGYSQRQNPQTGQTEWGRLAGDDDSAPSGSWIAAPRNSTQGYTSRQNAQTGQTEWGRIAGDDDNAPSGSWVPMSMVGVPEIRDWTQWDSNDQHRISMSGYMPGRSLRLVGPKGDDFNASVQLAPNFNPYAYRNDPSATPLLSDFYNAWNKTHFDQYGVSYNRPWTKHGEFGLRDQFVNQYTDAIKEYNQLYKTNYTPDQQAINAFSRSPTYFAALDSSERKSGGGFKNFLKVVAPIALGAFGGPLIAGALGGGIGGAVGAGAITGGLGSAIQGGDPFAGALKGGISGGLSSGASAALNNLTGGSGMFDFSNMDLSSQFGDMGGGFDLGNLDMGGESLPFTVGNMGYGPEGSAGVFPTIQNDLDMLSQPQPNFGGPGYPSGEGLPAGWAQALSSAGLDVPSGGNFMSQVQKFLTDPRNLMRGGGALANMLIQNRTANKLTSAADRAAFMNQSLNQAQRFPYQAMLSDQMNNPSTFFQTNPVVQAKLEQAKRQFEANTAKMGAGGKVFSDYLNSMNASMADTYYKNADLLSRLGGFSDGPGNAGSIYGDLSSKAAQASGAGFQGFSQFFNPQKEDPQLEQLRRQISEKINQIFL